VATIQSISAGLTDLAREYRARAETEGILLGDWSFQVGTDGFEALNPDVATDVDFSLQVLGTPVGSTRYLGRVIGSGVGAVATPLPNSGDQVTVTGLTGIPNSISKRWLRIFGSADPNMNGTWVISKFNSATSVDIHNPLLTASDNALNWELREACILNPNTEAVDFHGRLESPDATVDNLQLGEVGIFCRILKAPSVPGLVGTALLFANSHHPAFAKMDTMTVGYHICVQA
jgi:hypothetical protein